MTAQWTSRFRAGRVTVAATILVSPTILSFLPGALPVAPADDCPDVEVVFARGTNEPPGLGRVGDALVDALRQQTGGMNIDAYGVNYAAGKLQLHGGDGAKDTINHVRQTVARCPSTRIVLGGYSQGASVMDIVAGVPIGGISWGSPLPSDGGHLRRRRRSRRRLAADQQRVARVQGDRPVQSRGPDLPRGSR